MIIFQVMPVYLNIEKNNNVIKITFIYDKIIGSYVDINIIIILNRVQNNQVKWCLIVYSRESRETR